MRVYLTVFKHISEGQIVLFKNLRGTGNTVLVATNEMTSFPLYYTLTFCMHLFKKEVADFGYKNFEWFEMHIGAASIAV